MCTITAADMFVFCKVQCFICNRMAAWGIQLDPFESVCHQRLLVFKTSNILRQNNIDFFYFAFKTVEIRFVCNNHTFQFSFLTNFCFIYKYFWQHCDHHHHQWSGPRPLSPSALTRSQHAGVARATVPWLMIHWQASSQSQAAGQPERSLDHWQLECFESACDRGPGRPRHFA